MKIFIRGGISDGPAISFLLPEVSTGYLYKIGIMKNTDSDQRIFYLKSSGGISSIKFQIGGLVLTYHYSAYRSIKLFRD